MLLSVLFFGFLLGVAPSLAAGGLEPVAAGVYRFKDTCNVYAIVQRKDALLVDFGAGDILPELARSGVQNIGWILHTHFHRDQAQGDRIARARGIRIAVPEAELKYFNQVETMWSEKKVFHLYDMRNEFFALRENLSTDRGLKPNEEFSWNGIRLKVLSTPGHTEGSVSFLYETGGKKLVFCGDLVGSAGKVPTMHDLEWGYVGTRGIEAEVNSLSFLMRDITPDIVLPSHGSASVNFREWYPKLAARLASIYSRYNWIRETQWRPSTGPVRLTKHIWQMRQFVMKGVGYLIVADSGRAMLWDMNEGEVHYLDEMKKITGFKSIDLITSSHYHDDHTCGINAVKRKFGAQFWIMDHMADVYRRPMAYNLPCLCHEPIQVERILHDGEQIVWEGLRLQFFYLPGQTEYTQGMLVEEDGKRYMFDGDNVAKPLPGAPLLGHFVCRNYQRLDGGHVYAAKKLLQLKLDFICPNHFECSEATPWIVESYLKSSEDMDTDFRAIIDQPDPQIGVDNNWASIYPYQAEAGPGSEIPYELRIRNWLYHKSRLKVELRVPESWSVEPASLELEIPAKSESVARFVVKIPLLEKRANRRLVLAADVWRDGDRLGEITEALVNMNPMRAH